ncbi:helix-turn-helix domain-containing protein [Bacillus sp. FJAT-27916]|uniref:helix-turn-helix domain-containing protein n=1 Tax=Bacillus sp. FJAT-27916 TaxID=1679169 RepID=UPI0009E1CC1C|nr:helix-turn-helix domain-containing protein [Bacillus sp. FJAT-27916]
MDFSVIGQRIRELRKSLKLSQEELAEGICTQAQISKIEKGDVFPYANTLYLISKKLGVDVNYFFEIGSTPRIDYVNEVIRQLRLARRSWNFEDIERIISLEEKNPLFTQNNRNLQMILWHKAIYQHAVYEDSEKAREILWDAINKTHTNDKIWSEREIELLITIGSIYADEGRQHESLETLLQALEHIKQVVFISDNTILPRLCYNLARVYAKDGNFEESIFYCKMGIKHCLEKDNLYPLGELHYHLCFNYEKIGRYQDALSTLDKAATIFELIEDYNYLPLLEDGRKNLLKLIDEEKQKETDHAL